MKKCILIMVAALIATISFSQNKTTTWKQLDDFHELVTPVFHTFEKGNYHAAKDSAGLVLERAKKWQAAPIPTELDSKIYKPLLDRLVLECSLVYSTVQAKKPDDELKPLLRKAHNTFHEILGKYTKPTH